MVRGWRRESWKLGGVGRAQLRPVQAGAGRAPGPDPAVLCGLSRQALSQVRGLGRQALVAVREGMLQGWWNPERVAAGPAWQLDYGPTRPLAQAEPPGECGSARAAPQDDC